MTPRDKALHTIVKLRALADDTRAPDGERENARSRIKALQERHDIKPSEKPKPTATTPPPSSRNHYDWFMDMVNQQDIARRRAEAERQRREHIKHQDARGQPITDPWADTRTHAQRQADLNASFGANDAWYRETFRQAPSDAAWRASHKTQRCDPKLSFFDGGGIPRRRNTTGVTCAQCGVWLNVGDGAEFPVVVDNLVTLAYGCCDKVPGPRKKKSDETD